MFVWFAVAVIAWSFAVFRWVLSRSERSLRMLIAISICAVALGTASIVADVQRMRIAGRADASPVVIDVIRRDDWWQIDYSTPLQSFTTANELHLPAGAAVRLRWHGVASQWIDVDDAVCIARGDRECVLIAEPRSRRARFISLWPPMWRTVRVVADSPQRFAAWSRNEAAPAKSHDAFLFVDSGCGYCHVIRGVTACASQIAPDLTHFGARKTIAGTAIAVNRATLTGWVVHSRGLKPKSRMPDNAIDPRVLHPLIAFLQTLQ